MLHYDGLVQERRNSSALAMELRLSCHHPSINASNDELIYSLRERGTRRESVVKLFSTPGDIGQMKPGQLSLGIISSSSEMIL